MKLRDAILLLLYADDKKPIKSKLHLQHMLTMLEHMTGRKLEP